MLPMSLTACAFEQGTGHCRTEAEACSSFEGMRDLHEATRALVSLNMGAGAWNRWQTRTRREQGHGADGGKLQFRCRGGETLVDTGLEELDSGMKRHNLAPDGKAGETRSSSVGRRSSRTRRWGKMSSPVGKWGIEEEEDAGG